MSEQKHEHTGLEVAVIGEDGNVFNLIGIVSRELKRNGYREHAKEMSDRVLRCGSYQKALSIMQQYVYFV